MNKFSNKASDMLFSVFGESRLIEINFKGEDYLLVADESGKSGSIATRGQYENFETSFAHLNEDGSIMRYCMKIGTIDDIKFGKEIKL